MTSVGISYSHFEKDYLEEIITTEYDIFKPDQFELHLFNNGFNVIYHLATTAGGSYMFRIRPSYDFYDITDETVQFVLEYQEYLRSKSFPVPRVLGTTSGQLFGTIEAPEGDRIYSIHEVVSGKSIFPMTPVQSQGVGKYLATMHLLSRDFTPTTRRTYFTSNQMLEIPRVLIKQHPELFGEHHGWLIEVIETMRSRLTEWSLSDFVVIHGDFWHGNVLIDTEQSSMNVIDFDFACYAPKELDIASFLILGYQRVLRTEETFDQVDDMYQQMIEGYHEIWNGAINMSLLYDLAIARLVWTIGGYVAVIGIQAFSGIQKRLKELTTILRHLITKVNNI